MKTFSMIAKYKDKELRNQNNTKNLKKEKTGNGGFFSGDFFPEEFFPEGIFSWWFFSMGVILLEV